MDGVSPVKSELKPALEFCNYCKCSGKLLQCLFCGLVAYCCPEHQQCDWKRHKPKCIVMPRRAESNDREKSSLASGSDSLESQDDDETTGTSSIKHSRLDNNVTSTATATAIATTTGTPIFGPNTAFRPYNPPPPISDSSSADLLMSMAACTQFPGFGEMEAKWIQMANMINQNANILPVSFTAPLAAATAVRSEDALVAALKQNEMNGLMSSSSQSMPAFPHITSGPSAHHAAMALVNAASGSGTFSAGSSHEQPLSAAIAVQPHQMLAPPAPSSTSHSDTTNNDDDDCQVINVIPPKNPQVRNNRKRPTPSNSAEARPQMKDHTKNLVYQTTLQDHQRHLMNKGHIVNIHQAMVLRLKYIADHVVKALNEYGWAVVDNFLGQEHCKFTAKEIERLHSRGLFSAGQLMGSKDQDEHHIKDIRSDNIYWYDGADQRAHDAATIRLLVSMIDSVIQNFKKRVPPYEIGGRSRELTFFEKELYKDCETLKHPFPISGRSKAMLAIYPGNGSRYVKHVDNPMKDGRCITCIYYCNEDWDMTKDGGALRLYPDTSLTPLDIDPRADRIVLFWSDRRNPHEVMPVFRNRMAITIWYMDKAERAHALQRQKDANDEEAARQAKHKPRGNIDCGEPSSSQPRLEKSNASAPVMSEAATVSTGMHRLPSLQEINGGFIPENRDRRDSSSMASEDVEELNAEVEVATRPNRDNDTDYNI